jgi:hypothetical protein
MSVVKFKGHTKGASGKNVDYIMRDSACESVSFHNLDELRGDTDFDSKVNARSYAYNREDEEKGRTHYRVILSFDGKETSEKAQEMAAEFLKENFPDARGIVAIHQDTDNTHAHIWLDARQLDDKKIHSPKDHINQLSSSWQQQYDREYGTERAQEFAEKREEMRQWREDKHNGIDRPRPERAEMNSEQWRDKEAKDLGIEKNDETRIDSNQRPFEVRDSAAQAIESALAGSVSNLTAAERQLDRTGAGIEREAGQLDGAKSGVAEQAGRVDEATTYLDETVNRELEELRDIVEEVVERDNELEEMERTERDGMEY